ncbi:MAG TPA: hypothetical protein VLR89_04180 [Anaerolineaceae bacterium]|nr:hypothetical protein [Anaerolineaceae bacterium]
MDLNDDLLQQFITTFYGSGNYAGDYWFVGMEEGGGSDLDQVTARLNAWKELGETELVDIYEFHIKINYPEYFTDPVKLQRTWMQQARIILKSKGLTAYSEDVKEYQRDFIGRRTGESCLLELLPLPSPSTEVWNYDHWSNLPFLTDRRTYRDYCIPWRSKHIQSQISICKPKVVVFLGLSYLEYWRAIAGQSVRFVDQVGYLAGQADGTRYIVSKHPATKGITNAYFEKIGTHIYHSS